MEDNQQAKTEFKDNGGVKTPEGKAVSKFNAVTHGILRQSITEYEQDFYSNILADLEVEFQPVGIIEQILIERIAIHYFKLIRIQKAETEYIKSQLNPHIETSYDEIGLGSEIVKEGYVPKLNDEGIKKLVDIYARYETTTENRLFRALHELERVQRFRKGEYIPPPITADVNQVSSFGEKGINDE